MVFREASKRAGGIQLQYGGWDAKLKEHNERSGGKLQEAVEELKGILGWIGGNAPGGGQEYGGRTTDDVGSVRQELLSGTYGANLPVPVGRW